MNGGIPTQGTLAGIDFGTVRIGVALSDQGQTIASPFENYQRRTLALDKQFFETLVRQEAIAGFVVGLPVHMSGDESDKSKLAREFGTWLNLETGIPVTYFDERFSTALARQFLQDARLTKKQRAKRLDKVAAQLILTCYLESDRESSSMTPMDDGVQ